MATSLGSVMVAGRFDNQYFSALFPSRLLDQEPLFGMRFMAQIVAMSHANPYVAKRDCIFHEFLSAMLSCAGYWHSGTRQDFWRGVAGVADLVAAAAADAPLSFGCGGRGSTSGAKAGSKTEYEPRRKTPAIRALRGNRYRCRSGIGQHHAARHTLVHQRTYLVERDLRLGLKSDLFGYARLLAPLLVVCPGLGKIEAIGGRNAGLFGGQRDAYCYTAVLQFAQLTAVLTATPTE